MSIAAGLRRIANEYPAARTQPYTENPLAKFIRDDAPALVRTALNPFGKRLLFKGGAGAGRFPAVPWLAIFDPLVTSTATKGYYVVFLYAPNGDLFLSLNQGATGVRTEFKSSTREVLRERAALIRARLPDYSELLPLTKIDLGSAQQLPRDHEAGHALGILYPANDWPSDEKIAADVTAAVRAYRSLIFRGGIDPSPEAATSDEALERGPMTLTEVRQYRMHRRVERNPSASGIVKLVRGTVCEACEFNFGETYGALGADYIEAHHLRPVSSLEEGVVTELDVTEDFVVLCSNCHRMIHRMDDCSDIDALRTLIKTQAANTGS